MRVIVEANVFRRDRGLEYHADLLALFRIGLRSRHTIEIDNAKDPRFLSWREAEGKTTRDMCDEVLARGLKRESLRRRARTVRIADMISPSWSDMRLPLTTALDFLQRPLVLLLENERNDPRFLRTISRLVDGFNLDDLEREKAIEYRSKGGTENLPWLKAAERTTEERLRLWVLSDSDARRPWRDSKGNISTQRLGKLANDLLLECEKHGIPIHVLDRRSIENYLPLPVLKKWSEEDKVRESKYKGLCELSEVSPPGQRYHYNMKDGFTQDVKHPEHASKVGDFHDNISDGLRASLANGFNTRDVNVADLFKGDPIYIQTTWLEADQQENEARRIVKSIKEHL